MSFTDDILKKALELATNEMHKPNAEVLSDVESILNKCKSVPQIANSKQFQDLEILYNSMKKRAEN